MPGVSSRFLPPASWLLIVWTESDGVATKKSRSATVRPAVMPVAQEMPLVLVCGEGTRTW